MDENTEVEYEGNEVVDERGFNFFMVNNSLVDIEHLDNGITKPSEIAVFCAIAFHADSKTRKAFPSIKKVAKEARVGERTARSAIRVLEECGYLKVERRFRHGRQMSNLYTLVKR